MHIFRYKLAARVKTLNKANKPERVKVSIKGWVMKLTIRTPSQIQNTAQLFILLPPTWLTYTKK